MKGERMVREDRIGMGREVWWASKILRAISGRRVEGREKRVCEKSCVSLQAKIVAKGKRVSSEGGGC